MMPKSHPPPNELCQVAVQAATAAGDALRTLWNQPREIRNKGFRDLVTDADLAAQARIVALIQSRYSDHGFLTEEEAPDLPTIGSVRWIIDPLDGTSNYSRQVPLFSVSVAAVDEQDRPLAGAIYDPMRSEGFAAAAGHGAFSWNRESSEQRPLQISQEIEFIKTLVGFDWSRESASRDIILAQMAQIAPRVHTVRAIGSAALGLAWVAAGRMDAYFNMSLYHWDVAAGMLLIQEAGGRISDLRGEPWAPGGPGCLASNGLLHEKMLPLLFGK